MNQPRKSKQRPKPTADAGEKQIDEIRAALKEADACDFASDKEVMALARKWQVRTKWCRETPRPRLARSGSEWNGLN